MIKSILLVVILLIATSAQAQVVIDPLTASVDFESADHLTIIPDGYVGAGSPLLTNYQAQVFTLATDVTVGAPLVSGLVIDKTLVTPVVPTTVPPQYHLTFAQLGLTTGIPKCTVVAPVVCPQYYLLIEPIGPGGSPARAIGAESDPFSLAALLTPIRPAGPRRVKIKGL